MVPTPLYPHHDAPATPGSDVTGKARPTTTTLPASRVPRLPSRLDTVPGGGALACPVCGVCPSPVLMPSQAPRWLLPRLRLRAARLRALRAAEARLAFAPWGWA